MAVMTEQDVEKVMADFNFASVSKCMEALGWTYFDTKPDMPSIERLKMTARRCLMDVLHGKAISSSTGGFSASRETSECGEFLTLEWTPVTASNEP